MKSDHTIKDTMEEKRKWINHLRQTPRIMFIYLITFIWIQRVSSFNYDYSSACTRPYRSGRSGPPRAAPCDLSKQTYCNLPGETYPWHAVRRFVHENQGLMRRMYGEQRHIAVLKAEIENNDIDSEIHQMPKRDNTYSRHLKDRDILNTKFVYSKRPTGRSSESYTIPHFRPVQTTPTTTTTAAPLKEPKKQEKIKNKIDNKESATSIQNTTPPIQKQSNEKPKREQDDIKMVAYKTSYFEDELKMQNISKENLEMNKIEPEIITLEAAIKQSIESNSVYPSYGISHKNISLFLTTSTQSIDTSAADTTTSEYITPPETTSPPDFSEESTDDDDDGGEENGGWKPLMMDKVSTLPPTMLFSQSIKEEQNKNDRIDFNVDETYKESSPVMSSNTAATTHLEGQLFQDTVQEEVKPIVKLRGVNACPVKEEVVAPFWANNTRGEVLALLNLYPFEQYVHWEKCTHEHKQMFCREGCRCEQQYRLHRLLAYDPNNECRGIFSDWFKFPSCCVCKCYDMPLEFRVTSRSPRTIEPEIDEAVKKEMYNHAASDWYTINIDD